MDGSPPVFEQIFRNARFAQGGNAFFEGKVSGNPQPELSWTREGQPLAGNINHLIILFIYSINIFINNPLIFLSQIYIENYIQIYWFVYLQIFKS